MKHLYWTLALLPAVAGGCAATDRQPAQETVASVEATAVAATTNSHESDAGSGSESPPGTAATSGERGGGIVFNVSYRMPANRVCSHDRATGSHFEQEYCRSDAAAREERETAQEFLLDRMRNSH